MMKYMAVSRIKSLLYLEGRQDFKFGVSFTDYMIKTYKLLDKLLRRMGNDAYGPIYKLEVLCTETLHNL